MPFYSRKTYTHAQGLTCCFRQWRAVDSHCRFIHGYALEIEIQFVADQLDARHWVVDFGGMKGVKAFLHETFDHKTLVAADDPELPRFQDLAAAGLIDLRVVPWVGCEAFTELVYDFLQTWLAEYEPVSDRNLAIASIEVREHAGNAARYVPDERRLLGASTGESK